MANNIVKYNTRVQLKYDTLSRWNDVANTFKPLKGEVCVVNPSENLGSGSTTVLFKVGDGDKKFGELPYLSALAADVYGWAKAASVVLQDEKLEFRTATKINEETGEEEYQVIYTVDLGVFATDEELGNLEDRVEALEGTVTNIGEIVDKIPDDINEAVDALGNSLAATAGNTLKTITGITYDEATHEATVTYANIQEATTDKKGVVKLSDSTSSDSTSTAATSKAVKLAYSLANDASGAASAAQGTAGEALGIANDNAEAIAEMVLTKVEGTDSYTYIKSIAQTDGKVTATTGVIPNGDTTKKGVVILGAATGAATYERVEGLAGDISSINNKISNAMHFLGITSTPLSDGATTTSLAGIEAKDIVSGSVVIAPYTGGTEKYEFVWTGSAWEMLGQEGSFAIKGSIMDADIAATANIDSDKIKTTLGKTNLTGDITDLNNRLTQAEEDIDDLEGDVASHKSFSKVKIGTTTLEADGINDTLNVAAGTAIVVTGTVNNDTMTIAHATINPEEKAKGNAQALNHEDAFDVIESVTVNAQGHVTAYQPRTLKLPKEYDDSALSGRVTTLENTAWKTSTNIKTTTTDADTTQKGALAASDLTIGTTEVAYIIFDCGSSTVNV